MNSLPPELNHDGSESLGQEEITPDKDSLEKQVDSDLNDVKKQDSGIENLDVLSDATIERDTYLADLQRVQAEFLNFKKRQNLIISETKTRARGEIIEKLLPLFDACDVAVAHGAKDVESIRKAFFDTLTPEGLEVVDMSSDSFDPSVHEAVSHEPALEGEEGPLVVEVLRQGYFWEGKILRPAMVKVRG
tara:strand:- start:438 stop:1007 length:570 start_codon:yes stop_codon:yes gene_type:complete